MSIRQSHYTFSDKIYNIPKIHHTNTHIHKRKPFSKYIMNFVPKDLHYESDLEHITLNMCGGKVSEILTMSIACLLINVLCG